MSPAETAVKYARRNINKMILADAFLDPEERVLRGENALLGAIQNKIIKEFLARELSMLGGTTKFIELENVPFVKSDNWTKIYTIPPENREGKDIVRATLVNRGIRSGTNMISPSNIQQWGRNSGLPQAVEQMARANLAIPKTMTAEIKILAPNMLQLRDFNIVHLQPTLECQLAFSDDLNEITPPYQQPLNELVLLAVKNYIYNELSLELDMGKLVMGRELGKYGDIVESYADAGTMYEELKPKWRKYLMLMDRVRSANHYRAT